MSYVVPYGINNCSFYTKCLDEKSTVKNSEINLKLSRYNF